MMAATAERAKQIFPRYAVVRIRGVVNTPRDVEAALYALRLRRKFAMSLVVATPNIQGMLEKATNWITWGEVDADTLAEVLAKRGRIVGDKPLTLEHLKKYGWSSFEEVALAYVSGEIDRLACPKRGAWPRSGERVLCIPYLKPFFRLHPPTGGFKNIKLNYAEGGDLGYRGIAINELLWRMI
ncbi:MAG: 50S ribosomal protein L30 [Thermoproteus sp. AZ2]|jgi:large subunit ribosomal protein L30|uniref:50S ribosomal protein L30 n=1 Tax=Thermoproteus sp. AZ2 TaxID=1609232 RepID=A0ACC6V1I5_9CREN|nr:MAG: 50S ribosomal protein L30 [Thermoproteus sp. AZ2]